MKRVLLQFVFLCGILTSGYGQVKFNEVQTSNSKTQMDPDFFKYKDWIELYNTSSSAVDISGYYLTDNKDKPRKWQVPTGQSIGAGKFLLVYCDGEDVTGQAMHTNFKLSTGGDVLYMYSSSMLLLDSVNIKPIEADYTYGRLANGTGAWAALSRPTPGASNVSTTVKGLAPKPTFSINGGFYSKDQNVTLSSNLEGAVIRYTTDGSEPNENSPIYSGAIKAEKKSSESLISGYNRENKTQVQHYQWSSGDGILSQPSVYNWGEVEKGFVIKAKVFHPDYVPSVTACQTYFINMSRPSLPIVSVTVDKGSFFSADSGIYIQGTNGVKRGGDGDVKANWNHDDWERKVYVEYFDGNGNRQFGVNAGAKVMGAISRHSDLKSLNIIMRKKYEDGKIEYPIFGDEGLPTYESFILRNSGNDWEQGMFARDAVAQAIVRGQCDLETQAYQPVVMYLNGEYWSIINLRERYDKHYFGGYYDYVDEGNIDLLKINKEKNSFNAADGDSLRYEEMMAYLKVNSMEDAEKYEYVKNHYLDVDNMINYYIAQLFCQNTDWPDNNMRLWRPRTENGKFRFPWYDTDFGYGLWGGGASTDPFNNFYDKKKYAPVILFDYMMKNDDFKNEFIQRFHYMLNTVYEYNRSKDIINGIEDKIANERSISDSKWYRSTTAANSGYRVSSVRSFAESRVSNMRGFLNSRYGSKGTAKLTVNFTSSQGSVQLCGLNVTAGYSGSQYKSTPIRMTAIPKDGYKFVAWQTGNGQNLSSDMEYKLTITGDYTIKAVFESRSTESNLYINEFLTSNSTDLVNDANKHEDWIEIYNGGNSAVDMAGLYLSDDSTNLTKYQIPYGEAEKTTIAANGYLLFWADKEYQDGPLHLPFKLDRSEGVIILSQKNSQGAVTILNKIRYSQQNTDVSYGRYPDGTSNMIIFTQTTPNATNTIVSDTYVNGLVINEFMSKNSSTVREETGSYADWFEIYNTTSSDIDLGGLFVTNDLNNLNKYMIPKGEPTKTTIKAGGYYIFWCDKQIAINPNHVDFKLPAEKGDIAIVQLRGSENYIIDQVSYSNQGENISFGRYPNESSTFRYLLTPTPNAKNANNASVQTVSGITINEVLAVNTSIVADETGAYSDYIEFYNGTNAAIDLGGLFISDSLDYSLRYRIPTTNSALTTVQAGKWITFWADGKPELGANHLDFSLNGTTGEDVVLSQITAAGELVVIDNVSFEAQTENVSYGRYPEGADNWEEMSPTYKQKNQSVNSSVALKTLTTSNGEITPSVSTSILAYECAVPAGTTAVPTISATTVHERASVTITQAATLSDQAIIKVISANGYNSETYTVSFKIAASSDATLATLELGGGELSPAFSPTVYNYVANLNTTYVPYVTAIASDENAMVSVDYAETISEATVITVTAENGSTKQYEITYSAAASSQNVVTEWSDDFTNGIGNVSTNNSVHIVAAHTTVSGPPQHTENTDLAIALDEKETDTEYGYVEYHLPTGYVLDGTSALNVSMTITVPNDGTVVNGVKVSNQYMSFSLALVDAYGNVSNYMSSTVGVDNYSSASTYSVNFGAASFITKSAIVAVRIGLYAPADSKKERKKALYLDNLVIGPTVATGTQHVVTLSDNADLESISLNSGTLSPAFNKDVHSYTVTLPAGAETIPTVSAVALDETAYLEVAQASSLDGTAYVKVISQDLSNVNEYAIQYIVTPDVVDGYTDYVIRPAAKGWSESSDLYALTYNGGDMQIAYTRSAGLSDAITYNLVTEDYKILDLSSNPYASVTLKTTVATSLYVELFDANGNTTATSVAAEQCSAGYEYATYTFDFTGKFATANPSSIYGMKLYLDKGSSTNSSGTITIDELRFGKDVEITVNAAPVWTDIPSQTIQTGSSFTNINLTNFVTDDATESSALIYELVNPSEYLDVTITSGVLAVSAKDSEWIGSDIVKVRATDSEGASSVVSISFVVEELKIDLTSVSFSQSKVIVSQNTTVNLASYLSYAPSNATIESYEWSVSDVQSAEVNGVGVLTNKLDYGTEDVTITVVVTDKSGNRYTKTIDATLTGCPTAVTLVSTSATKDLFYGETAQLSYTLTPSDACVKSVTYSSSNPTIATVSETGVVTASSNKGYTDITISVNDGFSVKTAVCRVNVSKDCSGDITLSLNKSSLALVVGDHEQLIATITPQDECTENNDITWTSSNNNVATVSNGIVNAAGVGPATITATTTGNGVTVATCTVNVSSDCHSGAVDVAISEMEKTIYLSSKLTLTAEITTDNPCDEEIVWSSTDETVATVEDGHITPLKYGTTVIRATARQNANSYAECVLTVEEKKITDITVSSQDKMMYVGAKQTLTAEITPNDADDKRITWSSSDETKATVSDKGVVTALKSGNVTITATAVGSEASGSYTIQIFDIEVTNIVLNIEDVTLTIGDKQQVTVDFEPETATNKDLTWSSLDETIATVSEDGLIEGVGEGTTSIIVETANRITKVITVEIKADVIAVQSIDVTPASLSMIIGDTQELTAEVLPEDATNKQISWSSSDATVATVSSTGVVRAVGKGSAVITASSANKVTKDVNVTVDYQAITSASFSESSVSVALNQSVDLLPLLVLNPSTVSTKSIVWSVSGSDATIDEDGDLTNNLAYGTKTVTVTAEVTDMYDTKKTATILVVLTGCTTRISSINVGSETIKITKTGSAQITVTTTPSNACVEYIQYECANIAYATVSRTGKVSPVSDGSTTITVTVSDGYSTFQKIINVTVEKDVIPVSSVTFAQSTVTKYIGDKFQLSATVLPDDASDKSLTWTTSDRNKATVDNNGNVTILAAGTVTISATAYNGVAASCVITAKPVEVSSISLSEENLSLRVYDTERLYATILPDNATDKTILWASSNESIATVDANGLVTAKKAGTTQITATSVNAKMASCVLTVQDIEPTSITLSTTSCTLEIDETLEITTTLTPSNVTDTVLTWSSNDENVATVNNGVIKAIAAGSTTIDVVTGNGVLKKTISVKVNPLLATSILLNTTSATLLTNEQQQLVATVLPEKTTNKSVTWSSSDESIVSVDNYGKITAKSVGDAIITAVTSNGLPVTCSVKVTLNVVAVSAVSIEPASLTMHIGEISSLEPTITPSNATNKSLVWSSSLISVASVDQYGTVTANGIGTAIITATSANGNEGTCRVEVKEIEVESVSISDVSLAVGESQTLSALITPNNVTNKTVTWSIANESIATINENTGKITGVAEGTTKVTATASNGKKATANVTVQATAIPVQMIYPNGTVVYVNIDEPVDLAPQIIFYPANATNKSLKWTITRMTAMYGDATVATMENDILTGVAAGSVVLSVASVSSPTVTATLSVVVNPIYATKLSLNYSTLEMLIDDQKQLRATIEPSNASCKTVTWQSNNTDVAYVSSSGTITARAEGQAVITATVNDNSGANTTCVVNVIKTKITSVIPSETSLTMTPGQIKTLQISYEPADLDAPSYTWESSNPEVVTISDGRIIAVGTGIALVTVTATGGAKATIECKVVEQNDPPVLVQKIPDVTIQEGESSATIDFSSYIVDDKTLNLRWSVDAGGNNISIETNSSGVATISVVDPQWSGSQIITVYAKDEEGGEISAQFVVTVNNSHGVAISDVAVQTMKVYPNPTSGLFTLSFETNTEEFCTIAIYSESGRLVYKSNESVEGAFTKEFDLTGNVKGMYYIVVTLNGEQTMLQVLLQ